MADWKPKRTKIDLMEGIPHIKARKMTGNSTVQYTTKDGATHLKYHDTVVLTIKRNGTERYNSGGFRTKTTKERLNEYGNIATIAQNRGIWYAHVNGATYTFFDGMEFSKDGKLLGGAKAQRKALAETYRIAATIKQITAYCAALKAFILEKGIPVPAPGDCFICQASRSEMSKGGYYGAEVRMNCARRPSCIQSHLNETYIHGSLLWNAVGFAGYKPEFWMRHGDGTRLVAMMRRYLRYQMGVA